MRADPNRFGLLGRLLITLAVWIIPGTGVWTMALHPGTLRASRAIDVVFDALDDGLKTALVEETLFDLLRAT